MQKIYGIILFALLAVSLQAQTFTQTVRGRVTENNHAIEKATIQLLNTSFGTTTDTEGRFSLTKIPTGRYAIQISCVGYESVVLPEILIEAGKEKILEIELTPQIKQLDVAVVRAAAPPAQSSLQTITTEQTLRYAATYFDPARLATSFAGVVASNDQANGLVVRGNSPASTQWRLEGVEIVNPNHLNNAGTFSDRPTQTGGGVNILSAQLLDRADFLTGAFPAQYGNALGSVMDVHLRKGNDQKHEFTVQAGVIGIDLAAEGPLSSTSKASYLVNYRYSFTGLLAAMGAKLGDEDIRFQDLSFNLSLPTRSAGHFTIFGMGGVSSNVFAAQRDSSLWKFQKDGYDITFNSKMGAAGVTHRINLGPKLTWNSTLVASALENNRIGSVLSKRNFAVLFTETDQSAKSRYSVASHLSYKINANWKVQSGVYVTQQADQITSLYPQAALGTTNGYILQPYFSLEGRPSPRLSVQAGLHYLRYTFNKSKSVEPRASVRYQVDARQSVSVSYGLHSQLQLPQLYRGWRNEEFINANLDLTKAHHVVLGYEYRWAGQSQIRVEGYYQSLFNVPISAPTSFGTSRWLPAFSALNLEDTFVEDQLGNNGTGQNYGIEVTYQKFLAKNYYILATGSLYNSLYVGQDGVQRNTRFAGNHTFSVTAGKELIRKANRNLGINLRVLWLGGFRDSPIDVATSKISNRTIYKLDQLFTIKMKDYFRPDLRIYWKKNKNNFTRTWSVDIQNVSNSQNEAYSYYDVLQKQIVKRYQLGIIPLLSYRIEF
jgi:CarboxypepD_reg-like domain/TonB-dependent Receptor Plug Domain